MNFSYNAKDVREYKAKKNQDMQSEALHNIYFSLAKESLSLANLQLKLGLSAKTTLRLLSIAKDDIGCKDGKYFLKPE